MQRYSETDPPPKTLWFKNYLHAQRKGLTHRAARAYADLTYWGEHYGVRSPEIVSGARSAERQRELQRRWDSGDRRGMRGRPADNSKHVRGEAFDLRDTGQLHILGELAPYAGLQWSGTFRTPYPTHFELE